MTSLILVEDFNEARYISLLTTQGRIKRVELGEFANVRSTGIIAMNLEPGDG